MNDSAGNVPRRSGFAPAPKMTPPSFGESGQIVIHAKWGGGAGYLHFYGGSNHWPTGLGMPLAPDKSNATQWSADYWNASTKKGYFGSWFGDWGAWAWMSWAQGGGALPTGLPVQCRYWASSVEWTLADDGRLYPTGSEDLPLRYIQMDGRDPGTTYCYTLNKGYPLLTCTIEPV
jgi:hypothetical protein